MFMLATQRVAQHFVSASEEASLLISETVGAAGEVMLALSRYM